MTRIQIDQVAKDLEAVCTKNIEDLPVSRDLPRLARKFTLYENDKEQQFANDKNKDKIENVMFQLISKISQLLKNESADATQSNFDRVVNMNIHETLNQYLLQHYGRDHRVLKVLKTCNQSTVIATLYHVRKALLDEKLEFKDPRPNYWYLEFKSDGQNPMVVQRRKEQVYRLSDDKTSLVNLFQFEWKLEITFDSVEVNHVCAVGLGLLEVDFSTCPLEEEARKQSKKILEDAFANCKATNIQINF
jgi:hypothetical protein